MIERSALRNEVIRMKFLLNLLITLLLLIFAFCFSATAAEPKVPDLSKLPGVAKVLQVTGEVKTVDANSITVVKKRKEKVITVTAAFDSATVVEKDKVTKTVANIKVGDRVVVKYTSKDGKNIAKSVVIKPPLPKPQKETGKDDRARH
jgi:ABC-type Fe3+-hydroxamate transport system substrate-binding protein